MSTDAILVAGTASHVGKSTVAAGLCRLLANAGVDVAPFKAQNMSNNARAVLTRAGDWGEIGVSQYVQARAARVSPTTDNNPILLKPRGDGESQFVVDGTAVGHFSAGSYYDDHWETARSAAVAAYDRLAAEHEVIVCEGAGSIAEINLHDRDLANVETARFADAKILLVADIERGGAFASLAGTLELMPDDLRERVAGTVLTKFRGDEAILQPGIVEFEDRFGVPILGVLPHEDPGLPAEDSVSLPPVDRRAVVGDDDGVADEYSITIAVPRLPHISNFTDLEPLVREPGVRIAYSPPSETLGDADAVVIPGTKNTVDDLLALRDGGLAGEIADFDGPVVGLCGGYQMLGERIENAAVEGTGDAASVAGLGRLPVVTRFSTEKRVEQVTCDVDGVGPIAGATGEVSGYEIHMGETEAVDSVAKPVGPTSAATAAVLGTYLHDLFANAPLRHAFLSVVFERSGVRPPDVSQSESSPFERAAAMLEPVDLTPLFDGDRLDALHAYGLDPR